MQHSLHAGLVEANRVRPHVGPLPTCLFILIRFTTRQLLIPAACIIAMCIWLYSTLPCGNLLGC